MLFLVLFLKKGLINSQKKDKIEEQVGESGWKWYENPKKWEAVIVMFMGQFEHTIDAKGRTIVPVKYREDLGDEFIVTWGPDGCLYLYPQQEWEQFAHKLRSLPSSQKTRRIQRQFLSMAMEVALDKQGRILIPSKLREIAKLDKDLVFIGMMNRVEIWDRSTLESQEQEEDEIALEEAMDDLGISL